MKRLAFALAVVSLLLAAGCSTRHSQNTIYPGLVLKKGLYYKAGEGHPYTGIIHAYYGSGEKKSTATTFKVGRLVRSIRYYPTGIKYALVKFDFSGYPVEMTYYYPSGKIRVQSKGGVVRTWDEQGELVSETLSVPDTTQWRK